MVCEVFWVVVAGCLCLSLLCVLCPSCGAVPWGSVQLGGGFGPCWIMDGGEEGMRAGLEGTYPPPSLTLPTVPHPSPTLSFPPAFLSAQTVAIHAWREVGWGWLEMCLALSFCLSALPFFLSLVTLSSLSRSSSPSQIWAGKVKMIEVYSAENGLQMLRKRDKDIEYLDFPPL